MRKMEWRNPNHMKFESLHKTFNRQVDCISPGNVMGHVQLSAFARPRNEMKNPVGESVPKGAMQEWDLTHFILGEFPSYVKNYIRELDYAEDHLVIAYEFRWWQGNKKIVMGYVVTTGHSDDCRLLRKWVNGQGAKAISVIDEAITYITGANTRQKCVT